MIVKKLIYFLFFLVLTFYNNFLYGMHVHYEEDLQLSKNSALISEFKGDEIIKEGKAAITICTTTLKSSISRLFDVDHVALVFEIKHPEKDEIDLFTVHFGGDGHSSITDKGKPIFDTAPDTLIKVYRGKKMNSLNSTPEIIKPVYVRRIAFRVKQEKINSALQNIESDNGLIYSLIGGDKKNTYNCWTYVSKILVDAGINIEFTKFNFLKHNFNIKRYTSLLINCCIEYTPNEEQEKNTNFDTHYLNEEKSQKNNSSPSKKGTDPIEKGKNNVRSNPPKNSEHPKKNKNKSKNNSKSKRDLANQGYNPSNFPPFGGISTKVENSYLNN